MKTSLTNALRNLRLILGDKNIKFSLISVIAIILISTLLLSVNFLGTSYDYDVGDIANEDIRVPRDIEYVNQAETALERKRESEAVPIVFDKDSSILQRKLNMVHALINHATETLKQYPPTGNDYNLQIYAMKSRMPRYLHYSDPILLEILRFRDHVKLKKVMSRILIYIYDDPQMGILDKPYENPLKIENNNVTVRSINSPEAIDEVSRSLKTLKTADDITRNLYGISATLSPGIQKQTLLAIAGVINSLLEPNMSFNIEDTKRRIVEALKKTPQIMGRLKKGQTIVREGDTVTLDILNKIEIYNQQTASLNIGFIIGTFLIQIVFFMIFGYFLLELSSAFLPDKKAIIIIFTLIVIFMAYTFFISRLESPVNSKLTFAFMLPISFATMIISILYNRYLSIMAGIYIVFFTTLISGGYITTAIISFSTALVGVFVNENVEKRTDFLRGGLIIGVINAIIAIAVALIHEIPVVNVNSLKIMGIAFTNGVVNSILVLGILPIYENIFGITTKFKLLELSDLNADIFKEMLMKTPGTYNHSMLVSTMSEAACKEIGANHLMARVGAFYHDIGKIEDAGMYIENRVTDPRAREISPRDYAQLIISHVAKGVAMAERNQLPESVIDFIREHHGQTTMTFFYHQSLELAGADEHDSVNKSDFQYPGPKPHSKEIAVVMLADSIEAAARSLQNPTYEKLDGLVRKIVYNKLNEGELEFSDLSMTELRVIQETFISLLKGIFHTRIEYPEDFDLKKLEKKIVKNNGSH
ncbi:MAG: HDIG domain-containing protein [Spirochaetes bacterium]|nr:HDIG domain-containing protein [Spirochaetota bacterium]